MAPNETHPSPQSADLHSGWQLQRIVKAVRRMGELTITDAGMPVWRPRDRPGLEVCISLTRFRGNALVATSATPDVALIMAQVCRTLSGAWGFPVHCSCDETCPGECMSSSIRAGGVGTTLPRQGGCPLVYPYPALLGDDWVLWWDAPLRYPDIAAPTYSTIPYAGQCQR